MPHFVRNVTFRRKIHQQMEEVFPKPTACQYDFLHFVNSEGHLFWHLSLVGEQRIEPLQCFNRVHAGQQLLPHIVWIASGCRIKVQTPFQFKLLREAN